jgi:hypothetical protein
MTELLITLCYAVVAGILTGIAAWVTLLFSGASFRTHPPRRQIVGTCTVTVVSGSSPQSQATEQSRRNFQTR